MRLVGLADCNTFYASCERVFRPDLRGRPIVVLSNNDGCIVALSAEAKKAGIKRGSPYFKVKNDLERAHAAVFSSNYVLYQDMSDRVMEILKECVPEVVNYSIDESFFALNTPSFDKAEESALFTVKRLWQCTGLPVSVGIARTATLAKIANHYAKKHRMYFVLRPDEEDEMLRATPIDEVWGIGRRGAEKALRVGIKTAYDFAHFSPEWILRHFTVTGEATQSELLGRISIPFESEAKRTLTSGISFKEPVTDISEMRGALAVHVSTLTEKLEKNLMLATELGVQILTSRFKDDFSAPFAAARLTRPTRYAPSLTAAASAILDAIFIPGRSYTTARVTANGLISENELQPELSFGEGETCYERGKRELALASSVAEVNKTYGRGTLSTGTSGGRHKSALTSRAFLSPAYTTDWNSLPEAK